jgi:hypothetical protein
MIGGCASAGRCPGRRAPSRTERHDESSALDAAGSEALLRRALAGQLAA